MLILRELNRKFLDKKPERKDEVGISIYDQLVQDLYDEMRGVEYKAWSCINDENMAARSRNPNAPRVIMAEPVSVLSG